MRGGLALRGVPAQSCPSRGDGLCCFRVACLALKANSTGWLWREDKQKIVLWSGVNKLWLSGVSIVAVFPVCRGVSCRAVPCWYSCVVNSVHGTRCTHRYTAVGCGCQGVKTQQDAGVCELPASPRVLPAVCDCVVCGCVGRGAAGVRAWVWRCRYQLSLCATDYPRRRR